MGRTKTLENFKTCILDKQIRAAGQSSRRRRIRKKKKKKEKKKDEVILANSEKSENRSQAEEAEDKEQEEEEKGGGGGREEARRKEHGAKANHKTTHRGSGLNEVFAIGEGATLSTPAAPWARKVCLNRDRQRCGTVRHLVGAPEVFWNPSHPPFNR